MKETTPLVARVPRLAMAGIAREWFGGHRAATHMSNAMHLLFPAGERFFVRSVLHYQTVLETDLTARVRHFCKQEGRHAQAHERFFDNLRAQGHDIERILEPYERIAFGYCERKASPRLRLAITAALEHFTALFAEDALSRNVLSESDTEMRHLLEWHALEELEHKAVAFDILRIVAPSYALRAFGLLVGALGLGYFWTNGVLALWKSDGLTVRAALRELRTSNRAPQPDLERMLRGIASYVRPSFHPNDVDHGPLIASTLTRLEAEGAFATASAASDS